MNATTCCYHHQLSLQSLHEWEHHNLQYFVQVEGRELIAREPRKPSR
jgi:hypothetical protein